MQSIKLGIIFGGMSTENEVSIKSAQSILKNINQKKYDIYPIFLGENGIWYQWESERQVKKEKIENIFEYLKKLDILFPVLHGLYGEDGSIQGMFKLLKKPFVGCGILASSVGMDKVYTKIIFEKARLKQAPYEFIKKYKKDYILVNDILEGEKLKIEEAVEKVSGNLKFPMFIKPSNSGSSIGISKAHNKQELKEAIIYAAKFDPKILIEQGIKGKEVECAVLGNEEVIASCVGEVKSAEEFYSYDAKYNNTASKTEIPAHLPENITEEIRKQAIKAFKAIDGKGLSRVDFFLEEGSKEIYINDINNFTGFTNISMYPKLWEASGIPYETLLDRIIELSTETD